MKMSAISFARVEKERRQGAKEYGTTLASPQGIEVKNYLSVHIVSGPRKGVYMAKTVVGVFDDFTAAINTLPDLVAEGFPREALSAVTPDSKREYEQYLNTKADRPVAEEAGVGAVLGGLGGFLLSLGALTIPGIGP